MERNGRGRRRKLYQDKPTRKIKHNKKYSKNKMQKNMLECAAGHRSRFERLSHAYKCLQCGSCPGVSAGTLASIIFVVAAEVSDEDGESGPEDGESGTGDGESGPGDGESGPVSSVELTYLSMTLVRKITSSLMARSLPPAVASYFVETLKLLIHEMDLMSHLVRHFQASDQILSHLAVKSVSTYIIYHLHESGVVSPPWEQICLRAFTHAVPGPELDACLWSLTEALKRLLKGAFQGDTGILLSSFDSCLSVLCSKLLNEDENEANVRRFETTFCFLMDLLEALTASTLQYGANSCLQCQKLIHLHSPVLLKMISCSSRYFVKKRLLLLLKRVALQKAGEEWTSGAMAGPNPRNFDTDMTLLAQGVLTAVGANWLDGVQVDVSSSFWGTGSLPADASQPDYVVLRAASLLLLKSIEIHIETAPRRGLVDVAALCGYLQKLWGFLKRHSVQLREERHLCCWISLLFGEQDDDMMEAAKALLSIFLYYRQCSELDGLALLEEACASGYNPHCHFVLLLESISFDHSFLLDLLISTETCFLEYLVQYLKCLIADWQGFSRACGRMFTVSDPKTLPASLSARDTSPPCKGAIQPCEVAAGLWEMSRSAQGCHLVDYSSSEESDHKNVGAQGEEVPSSVTALDITEDNPGLQLPGRQTHLGTTHPAGLLNQLTDLEEGPDKRSAVNCEISARVLGCLSELREVLMRLHTKKLFPYNPAPLLKLLGQVEDCSLRSR